MNSADALALFYATLMISAPTFGWVLAGAVLARLGLFPQKLNTVISRWSFNLGLPLMLFAGATAVDYKALATATYLLAGVISTLAVLAMSWFYSQWRGHPREKRGIFCQGAFRSNLAIMGFALCISAYGELGAQLAAMAVAVMTTLYNVLAVWVLNTTLESRGTPMDALRGIAKNPLIIGIALGAALSISGLPIPGLVPVMGSFLSDFFLPVMLMCVGGAMNLTALRASGAIAWESTAWRLLISPLITVLLAMALGVQGEALGVLFLLVGAPAAAAGYIMVVAAKGDGVLMANIIVLSTFLSMLTITLGFFALSLLGLVGQLV